MIRTLATPSDNSTTANFRAWGKFVSDSMAAFGWVKGTDTGQIDWTSVGAPSSANAIQGFEIWKPGDGLYPVYVKIEYGSSAAGTVVPGVRFTWGMGTNGAGTLSGATSSVQTLTGTGGGATTNYDCLASGGTSWFAFCLFRMNGPMVFCMERSKDVSGNDTEDFFIHFVGASSVTNSHECYITKTGVKFYEDQQITCIYIPSNISSTLYQGKIGPFPIQPVLGYVRPPQLVALSLRAADWSDDEIVPITLYSGVTHNYRVIKHSNVNGFAAIAVTNAAIAIRWD